MAPFNEVRDPGPDQLSADHIKWWLQNGAGAPDDDAFELATLAPCPALARREASLRPILPAWFWEGEHHATGLSIGTGRGYFERKYWTKFDRIYVVDPSERTHLWQRFFKVWNVEILGSSLFDLSFRHRISPIARYGWLGSCSHDLFAEFFGWEFMWKLAMLVTNTLVIDGGVFDRTTPAGEEIVRMWDADDAHREESAVRYRRSQFTFERFRERIAGLWEILSQHTSPWADDGRKTVVLRRVLPPAVQRSSLDLRQRVIKFHGIAADVYKVHGGYYKQTQNIGMLLMYDTVSKIMGWHDLVQAIVFDGADYAGFIVKDAGDITPDRDDPAVSERLFMAIANWSVPLGLMPTDVARENIRIVDGQSVWIDMDLQGLRDFDARSALWMARNMYKEYGRMPPYVKRAFYEPE